MSVASIGAALGRFFDGKARSRMKSPATAEQQVHVPHVHLSCLDMGSVEFALPAGSTDAHIEKVLVSRFGLFVVASLAVEGQVTGTGTAAYWSLQAGKVNAVLDNPLFAIARHAALLAECLGIDSCDVFPIVVVGPQCALGGRLPDNVCVGDHIRYVKAKTRPIFTDLQVSQLAARIRALQSRRQNILH